MASADKLTAMTLVQALFFDLDETLLDGSGRQEAILCTCRKIASTQPSLDAARLLKANGDVWQSYWPEVADKWTLGVLNGTEVSLGIWRRTLRACGCRDDSWRVLRAKRGRSVAASASACSRMYPS